MEDIVICNASPEDIPALAELERRTFSAPWSEASLRAEIENPNALFLVCKKDGAPVGYINMQAVCGECYIGNLAVDAPFRRRGVAKRLLNELIAYAKKSGCLFVTLEVRASNFAARSLYEKAGFSVQGERRNYYTGPTENAVIYTLYLN